MMLRNKSHISFLKHVKRECRRYRITLILSNESTFKYGEQSYGGYFDHYTKELGVTHGNNEYSMIPLLVHEFSHMEQWIDNDPSYTAHIRGGYESSTIMDNWLDGKEYEYSTIKKAIGQLRDCELNCERRAILNIRKYGLDIDVDDYCQTANAYILFYNYIMRKRRWEYQEPVTMIPEIISEMPTDLYSLDYTKMSPNHRELYDIYLKKPL